jgi:hypothetical protein
MITKIMRRRIATTPTTIPAISPGCKTCSSKTKREMRKRGFGQKMSQLASHINHTRIDSNIVINVSRNELNYGGAT